MLGGSPRHRGGLEFFCERATEAVSRYSTGWRASWWPTEAAYLSAGRLGPATRAWRRLARADAGGFDLIWLQWSSLADLLFLRHAAALGVPVLVTPHLGANSRLQRTPLLRRLCTRLLARADRLALLFPEQDAEIALPPAVPRNPIETFLPELAFAPRSAFPDGLLRLLHAGRLSRGKGSFRMIALCRALRDRGVPFIARIVGRADAATTAGLQAEIAAAGLGDALALVGWMDEAALNTELGETDLLVHLSELDSFPLIVLEALAAGVLPVVASMSGAATMVERFGGFVTPDSSVTAAADWIAEQDPAVLRAQRGATANRVRDALAWPAAVRKLEATADATLARSS